jgi:hypothetical protein
LGEKAIFKLYRLSVDATLLTLEAQRVVALRLAALASGGVNAQVEAQRMVTEKMFAAMRAWAMMWSGHSPTRIVHHYRSRVRANERRLSRRR